MSTLIALICVAPAAAFRTGVWHHPPDASTSSSLFPRAATAAMQLPGMAQAATAAATVVQEVAGSVQDVEAPDADDSFVAIDESRTGLVDEEGLPLVYDKEAIQKYWEGQGGALQSRWAEFLSVSVPFLTRVAALLVSGGTDALNDSASELARDARERIQKLGPTYVKMGQMMSVRPDILPQAALDELTILQDGVEGFPADVAREMVEEELGAPIDELFSDFSAEPAAAASLAQVFRATLRSSGEAVAVKVQRPGVQSLVSKDLYVLRRAAEVERFAPQQRTDYVGLLNEWAVGFYTELDFKNEASRSLFHCNMRSFSASVSSFSSAAVSSAAVSSSSLSTSSFSASSAANMQTMARGLAEAGVTDVAVPRVYEALTTRRVLVSEWIDGRKLSECSTEEVRELVAIGRASGVSRSGFFDPSLGFFHSDPHPGNLMRPHDQSRARLVLIDFGLVARVQRKDQDLFDYAALIDDFVGLGILPPDCNRAKVLPLMDKALSPYVKGGGAKKYEQELKTLYGMDGSVESTVGGFQAMTSDMLTVLNDIPFSIPPYFALLARAVALQEVLYGGGDPALKGVVTPTRLAALVNSAAGVVARQEGAAFVDLDAVPDEGLTPAAAAAFVLSPDAASIRALLADEAAGASDLLLRQALRKAVPLVAAALPQPPRLPFLPPPPEPLELPVPLPPRAGAATGGGVPLPSLTSARALLDALAPPLSRDEELYALSLVDLLKSTLGEEAAALAAGDLSQDPVAAARAARPILAAALEAQGPAAADSAVARLARAALQLLETVDALPFGGGGRAGADRGADPLREVLAGVSDTERAVLQEELDRLAGRLRERLEERLAAVQ
ncbi:hypothetical protein EMIHUDRAFT_462052 [Emiliania huxleyi CCMP1516]|uniref:ABC1 atypical kinase-like domain-containing protein n=2 Tax=Emiliania huxleyi TaxID=2903 RepID=A0A0D3KZM6_EMIH1|nr:hypothetical protein EMIHUDRAFT_462052 [Emiliania huxleyi CCMP1516]EOD41211.1 hypothetical protein EMIHUDRAFT_462052 [Emiliania huxleyi CCMP1516]|eukprot:XP_005793640.1 hypothetical protein EMIHUDRAFT_462052 [Emiliania huxleyi CCMP1516]